MKKLKTLIITLSLLIFAHTLCGQYYQNDPDLIESKSGLKYKITNPGVGEHPKSGDKVWVHYYTKFTNDSIYDTSIDRGPLEVFLGQGQLIKGWEEGIRLIKPGGSILLIVPPHLAYGSKETNGIPANSTLIFEINLLQVNPGKAIEPYDVGGINEQKTEENISYFIIEPGYGPKIKYEDNAYIHYSGFLPDGSLFDSSRKKGDLVHITVGIKQLFEGLDIGLTLLSKGSKARLIIPHTLAYGSEGLGQIVPPNTNITLDIEVIDVKTPPQITLWNTKALKKNDTETGLAYYEIQAGEGELIKDEDIVEVHYSGYFSDGTLFDSSRKRFEPIQFPVGVGAVIDGWDQGIKLMRKGAKFQLVVPSKLAYGEEGAPPQIPPNANLIFDIEVIEVIDILN